MSDNFPAEFLTCQACGKCTGVCPVARSGLGYSPRRLMLKAIQDSTGAAQADRALFACLGCDRCHQVCPSGIAISRVMQELRAAAYERGASGQPAHGGVVQGLQRLMARGRAAQDRLGWLDATVKTASRGDVVYFVGCAPYFEPLFEPLGVRPLRTARNAIRLLNHVGITPVLLPDERCCGHDLLWQGDVGSFRALARHNLDLLSGAGARTVVFACPEGLRTFRLDYPRHFGPLAFETVHITEFLARKELAAGSLPGRVTYHDPCRLGRHLEVYDPPRNLLQARAGLEFVELSHSRALASCCGGTCWMECGAAVKSLQGAMLADARATGADRLVTACPKCDIHLACAQAADSSRAPLRIDNIVDLLAESLGLDRSPASGEAAQSSHQGGDDHAG